MPACLMLLGLLDRALVGRENSQALEAKPQIDHHSSLPL
jgi:hypothetical protein